MRLVHVYKSVVVEFLVRDEVGDERDWLDTNLSWLESTLTIYKGGVEIVFKWITWDCVKDEVYRFLKELGIEWDREEVKENHPSYRVVNLYSENKLVATYVCDECGSIRGRTC